MRILMVGGGSGGHVTPLKAVAEEVSKLEPNANIELVTDRRFYNQAKMIFKSRPDVPVQKIFAGKLRRYNSKSFVWHVLHLPTVLKNLVDVFKIGLGILQMLVKFMKRRPDIVFSKGGFVAVPVCFAAHLYKIPFIVHDSDAHPGLSSRIVSRWALKIATGMPTKFYSYPTDKTIYTGIPVGDAYQPITKKEQIAYKKQLGFDDSPLLLVTGGGTGARRLNEVLQAGAPELLAAGWQILQVTGAGKASEAGAVRAALPQEKQKLWRIEEFTDLVPGILAADVVVSRTGATTMQELANAKKATITVPSRFLTGGHQLKNAEIFQKQKAAIILDEHELEANPERLLEAVKTCYRQQSNLSEALHTGFSKPDAAKTLASLIVSRL